MSLPLVRHTDRVADKYTLMVQHVFCKPAIQHKWPQKWMQSQRSFESSTLRLFSALAYLATACELLAFYSLALTLTC